MQIINWIKNNKLSSFLILILLFLLISGKRNTITNYPAPRTFESSTASKMAANQISDMASGEVTAQPDYSPISTTKRIVIQDSTFSILVKNVREKTDKIINFAKENGGFMVSSNLSNPNDIASATVVVRVPTRKLKQTLEFIRNLSVKVVSENLNGEDVTDQYTDINARLETLNKTKTKFEDIMSKATEVTDILNIQRELISLQDQIDALKGQVQYFEKSADFTRITIYLSTDEIALPYTPSDAWNPEAIFKTAVRELVSNLRKLGTAIIWLLVFSVIWLPILIVILIIRKKRKSQTTSNL